MLVLVDLVEKVEIVLQVEEEAVAVVLAATQELVEMVEKDLVVRMVNLEMVAVAVVAVLRMVVIPIMVVELIHTEKVVVEEDLVVKDMLDHIIAVHLGVITAKLNLLVEEVVVESGVVDRVVLLDV